MEEKTISILGCGWLGLKLAIALRDCGFTINGSATSPGSCRQLEEAGIKPHLLNLHRIDLVMLQRFLDADYLIYNVPPSKTSTAGLAVMMGLIPATRVKAIIGISSTGIYRDCNIAITEANAETCIDKESTLFNVESILKSSGLPVTVLRLAGLFGEDRHPGLFAASATTLNNPSGRVNLVHRADVIEIVKAVIHQEKWNTVFHCCSDEHPTKKEFYSRTAPMIGKPVPVFADVTNDAFKIIDNTKAKETLNFKFRSLDDLFPNT